MFQRHKKLLIILFIFLLGGSVGWLVLFNYGAKWLKTEIEVALVDLKQKGYEISYSALEFQGNPFSLKAVLSHPHIKDPEGTFEWSGQDIRVTMRPWNWYTFMFTLSQDQKVSLPQRLSLGVLSLKGGQGTLKLTPQGHLDEISLFLQSLHSFIQDTPQPLFLQDVSLKITNMSHPLHLQISLRSSVKGFEAFLKDLPSPHPFNLSLEGTLSGFQGKTFPRSLAEWRDGGGVVDVKSLSLTWPPILMTGEGTLTFDKDMYPLGSFSSRLVGYQQALTHMVEAGCVKKKNAAMVAFVLDMLSRIDEKGSKHLTIPITLQDRKVSVGSVSLLKMGESPSPEKTF